jgi:hypothetical protein
MVLQPPFDCPDDESRGAAFIRDVSFIRGRDAVEEYLACGMYPVSTSVDFRVVTNGVTLVSRLKLPLLKFHAVRKVDEDDVQFLVRVELEAESVVRSYSRPEHDVCMAGLQTGVS